MKYIIGFAFLALFISGCHGGPEQLIVSGLPNPSIIQLVEDGADVPEEAPPVATAEIAEPEAIVVEEEEDVAAEDDCAEDDERVQLLQQAGTAQLVLVSEGPAAELELLGDDGEPAAGKSMRIIDRNLTAEGLSSGTRVTVNRKCAEIKRRELLNEMPKTEMLSQSNQSPQTVLELLP